mmetsp:Transcript_25121/g.84673  ORF Transcript_25121/g.84673 Transcript_25121/m.84673 type:complete len:257 (-) Transcript_25121:3516-4286(-)
MHHATRTSTKMYTCKYIPCSNCVHRSPAARVQSTVLYMQSSISSREASFSTPMPERGTRWPLSHSKPPARTMAFTASQRLDCVSSLYLRGEVPSSYLYHSISTIHQPSSKRSVLCACRAVACFAEPQIRQSQKAPSMYLSVESTLTARSWSFASSLANSSRVALSDGVPLEGFTRGTFLRVICVGMPPMPFIRQRLKSNWQHLAQPQKAVLTSTGPIRCAVSARTPATLTKRCLAAEPSKPLAVGTATCVKRAGSK